MAITAKLFTAVAVQVGHKLYIGAPGSPHCDIPLDCPEMTSAEWEYACEHEDECFGFVTGDGTFYSRSEAAALVGMQAEAQALQAVGLL